MPIVQLNGTDLFYLPPVGQGTPCLVMHGGLGFDHTYLHPWLDPLGDIFDLIYYDHRGNGRSGRPPLDTLTLSQFAADADASQVSYRLSGWFGGAGAKEDSAALAVNFLDAAGAILGTRRVGDVTAVDRGFTTGLVQRSAEGDLPPGSRFAEFVLTTTAAAQSGTGVNDASADNLAFVLDLKMDAPFSILPWPSASVKRSSPASFPGRRWTPGTIRRS